MASRTIENYVKQLYLQQNHEPKAFVAMGKLAATMGVVPGTATTMVKHLAAEKLVQYSPRTGVRLTKTGNQLALHVLRRHRLVELFLVRTLGLDWADVHAEAEELEHVISERVLDRMDALLGHPTTDPHGDPIPTRRGSVAATPLVHLGNCPTKSNLTIARVTDQSPAFLQFVRQRGLVPGAVVRVQRRDPLADAVVIQVKGQAVGTLSSAVAEKFLVAAE